MHFSTVQNSIETKHEIVPLIPLMCCRPAILSYTWSSCSHLKCKCGVIAQKVRKIMLSKFSRLMVIISISCILVSLHVKVVWCRKSDRKESSTVWEKPLNTPPSLRWIHNSPYCDLTWRTHPPSFSLIKALADLTRPDIWENETTEQISRESRWLSDTNSTQRLNTAYPHFTQ